METFNKKHNWRECEEVLECESYLAAEAGGNCVECGMRRIPVGQAEAIYRADAEQLNAQLPEPSIKVQCKRVKI